jgi:hypothetical protein
MDAVFEEWRTVDFPQVAEDAARAVRPIDAGRVGEAARPDVIINGLDLRSPEPVRFRAAGVGDDDFGGLPEAVARCKPAVPGDENLGNCRPAAFPFGCAMLR